MSIHLKREKYETVRSLTLKVINRSLLKAKKVEKIK